MSDQSKSWLFTGVDVVNQILSNMSDHSKSWLFTGVDVVDQILSNMSDQSKSRRQVLRQLILLNVIGSSKDIQKKQ